MSDRWIPIVVVWKKSNRSNKPYMTVFTKADLDWVNSTRNRKPVIPNESPFLELGMGSSFVDVWKEKYKIKSVQYWPPETKT